MRRDRNRLKSGIARKSIAISAATLGVLVGIVGIEGGASGMSAHGQTQARAEVESRRVTSLKAWGWKVPTKTSTTITTPAPTTTTTTTVVPAPTAKTTTGGSAPTKTTTPTTTSVTPTTTSPPVTTSGTAPNVPSGLGVPTKLVFDDEFSGGSLNQTVWSPTWFGNGSTQNGTVMESSNVAVGSNGLNLSLAANSTGGIVSTNPSDGRAGHTGFQVAPTAGHPVYVEFKTNLPAATNGQIANWPAVWLTGQNWPVTGEIDVMEGLSGFACWHFIFGSSPGVQSPIATAEARNNVFSTPGTHTFGVLWTTNSLTYVYDGQVVGTFTSNVTDAPMFLVMENSLAPSNRPTPALLPTTMTVRYVRVWQ